MKDKQIQRKIRMGFGRGSLTQMPLLKPILLMCGIFNPLQ